MCSKRVFKPRHSVATKISCWYSICFLVSSLFLLGSVYFYLKHYIYKRCDEELLGSGRRIELLYCSEMYYDDSRMLSDYNVPRQIIDAARQKIPSLKIINVEKEQKGGGVVYEVLGVAGRKVFEIRLNADGLVLKTEQEMFRPSIARLRNEFGAESGMAGASRVCYLLLAKDGTILVSSELKHWGVLAATRPDLSEVGYSGQLRTVRSDKGYARVLTRKIAGGNYLEIGMSLASGYHFLNNYLIVAGCLSGIMLIIGIIAGMIVGKRAMAGVVRVTEAARKLGNGKFNHLVENGREGREIELLVSEFNSMISRIRTLITDLKEVSDNIGHDLRTPLGRIKGVVETTLSAPRVEPAEYLKMGGIVVEECDHLTGIINTMLDISHSDSGETALKRETLDVGEIVRMAVELFLPVAEDKKIDLSCGINTPLMVDGDRTMLQRVIANLLDNAIKYNFSGGTVRIEGRMENDYVLVSVKDNGFGIAREDKKRIFKRFYRCDNSRTSDGNGLGLSLCQAFVNAHDGFIHVESEPGRGSSFSIRLPARK